MAVLSFLLLWLIGSGGYVTCGKRMTDTPLGLLLSSGLVIGPLGALACAVALIVICSRRLAEPQSS